MTKLVDSFSLPHAELSGLVGNLSGLVFRSMMEIFASWLPVTMIKPWTQVGLWSTAHLCHLDSHPYRCRVRIPLRPHGESFRAAAGDR